LPKPYETTQETPLVGTYERALNAYAVNCLFDSNIQIDDLLEIDEDDAREESKLLTRNAKLWKSFKGKDLNHIQALNDEQLFKVAAKGYFAAVDLFDLRLDVGKNKTIRGELLTEVISFNKKKDFEKGGIRLHPNKTKKQRMDAELIGREILGILALDQAKASHDVEINNIPGWELKIPDEDAPKEVIRESVIPSKLSKDAVAVLERLRAHGAKTKDQERSGVRTFTKANTLGALKGFKYTIPKGKQRDKGQNPYEMDEYS
jgi:hypothetical protein